MVPEVEFVWLGQVGAGQAIVPDDALALALAASAG